MPQPVIVWRGKRATAASNPEFEQDATLYGLEKFGKLWRIPHRCPFCKTTLQKEHSGDIMGIDVTQSDGWCSFCGYHHRLVELLHYSAIDMRMELGPDNVKDQFFHVPIVKSFDLNDINLPFNELGAWIARNPSDIYDLNHRRFEELVENIFKNIGYRTRLTQYSKDGGIDIYLLEKDGSQAIVQVKHNRAHRKLGVEVVREVRGLKLEPIHRDVVKAYIVTSSSFTSGAKTLAAEPPIITKFETELIDVERLLRELGTYNGDIANLPDLVRAQLLS